MNLAFIIIDDSELDCFIAKKIIAQSDNNIRVDAFADGETALNEIKAFDHEAADLLTVILLDLRLPIMDGFEFMEEFEKLPYEVKDKYIIYVLSSSMNGSEISRVCSHDSVIKMLSKPLTKASFDSIRSEIQSAKF